MKIKTLAAILLILLCGTLALAVTVSSLRVTPGSLTLKTTAGVQRFGVAATTGALTAVPSNLTDMWYLDASTLATGDAFTIKTVDGTFSGNYINLFSSTADTTVWKVGENGLTTITPRVATAGGLIYLDGTVNTSGDFLKCKAMDDTLNGGKYLNFLGGSEGSTAVFTMGEDGVTTLTSIAPTSNSLTITNNTASTGNLLTLTMDDDALSGGNYIKCLGGSNHATEVFSVTTSGAMAITNTFSATTCPVNIQGGGVTTADVVRVFGDTDVLTGKILSLTSGANYAARTEKFTVDNAGSVVAAGTIAGPAEGNAVINARHSVTTAEVNAGHTLVTVPAGRAFRLVAVKTIAVGGAATGETTIDILDAATKLVAFAQASQTQSAVLIDGGTGGAVLADGASYTARAAGNDITIGKTGADLATATSITVVLSYVLE